MMLVIIIMIVLYLKSLFAHTYPPHTTHTHTPTHTITHPSPTHRITHTPPTHIYRRVPEDIVPE